MINHRDTWQFIKEFTAFFTAFFELAQNSGYAGMWSQVQILPSRPNINPLPPTNILRAPLFRASSFLVST